jgi:transcriptional regulator with XRE-family HTH domain
MTNVERFCQVLDFPMKKPNYAALSAPLPDSLDYARIGQRLRERRLRLGLSTREVAEKAGITRQTLVRLESGHPCTPDTLHRIRAVLRVFVDDLIRDDPPLDYCVPHRPERAHWTNARSKTEYQKHGIISDPRHEDDPEERMRLGRLGFQPFFTYRFTSELPGGLMNQGMMEIYEETWVDSHPGEEWVYCLRGTARVRVREQEYVLEEGGAVIFDAREPHQYGPASPIGPNDTPVLLLIVLALAPKTPRKPRNNADAS